MALVIIPSIHSNIKVLEKGNRPNTGAPTYEQIPRPETDHLPEIPQAQYEHLKSLQRTNIAPTYEQTSRLAIDHLPEIGKKHGNIPQTQYKHLMSRLVLGKPVSMKLIRHRLRWLSIQHCKTLIKEHGIPHPAFGPHRLHSAPLSESVQGELFTEH
jgi:hypothetical protein